MLYSTAHYIVVCTIQLKLVAILHTRNNYSHYTGTSNCIEKFDFNLHFYNTLLMYEAYKSFIHKALWLSEYLTYSMFLRVVSSSIQMRETLNGATWNRAVGGHVIQLCDGFSTSFDRFQRTNILTKTLG